MTPDHGVEFLDISGPGSEDEHIGVVQDNSSNQIPHMITTSQTRPTITEHESLDKLFDTVSDNIEDVHILCEHIRPFAALALERNPTSILLREILTFVDQRLCIADNVSSGSDTVDRSCTNGQMNAIILHLNSNQYLLREDYEPATRIVTNDIPIGSIAHQTLAEMTADEEFLRELADLAM